MKILPSDKNAALQRSFGTFEQRHLTALGQHEDTVSDLDHLLQLRRDHHDGHAVVGELAHDGEHFRLRPDIDATGRLVH